ncbi:MAG: tRNA uridine-5-carboxymethylaminomethyl(34) synthesis GTPase MnmE [Chitinophagaceae bacterium]|nr:tRNA uridine-5-carboxymethylaminomethyl(34) synthesis GTPase MnmE [Chitinophagaceae bacterium]
MQNSFSNWDDTIVALATPQGTGAIGLIRLSGKNAIAIVNQLFPSKNLANQPSHTLHVGMLKEDDLVLDEVVVSLYKTPKSYTGEDVIEISCHGSPFVQQQIINATIEKGARTAKAGEFTQRAFLNGKLDLTQAEAVADIIASNSQKAQQIALNQLRGGFANRLHLLRDELINIAALIELELDFSEEDVEFADRKKLLENLTKIQSEVEPLLQSFKIGNAIKNGIPVAIVGKPNSGKSTLLNALLNEDRAIVSDIAGTTRDTIEDTLHLDGITFRFIDTAGLRHTTDVIEKVGVEKAIQKITEAEIILLVVDINETVDDIIRQYNELQLKPHQNCIIVLNKLDAISACNGYDIEEAVATLTKVECLAISAKNKLHLDKLLKSIIHKSNLNAIGAESVIITNARHYNELKNTLQSIQDIRKGLSNNISGDLIAVDIKKALNHIATLTGSVETDRDILGTIFGKFCIGK